MINMVKVFQKQNVLQAAQKRVRWIFDYFRHISVSVSGGKDSTVLFDLVYREAQKRGRLVNVFFLDQEAEYRASIEVVEEIMRRDGIVPYWYQIPCRMTNATSYQEDMLYAWCPELESEWIHPQVDISIKEPISGIDRFYKILEWVNRSWGEGACSLIGLRAQESLNRFRTVIRYPGVPGVTWSSKVSRSPVVKLYPIYDWIVEDVWMYIAANKVKYNHIYDQMYLKKYKLSEMRVSNLIHEKAYSSLIDLHRFEPDTYERVLNRLRGVQFVAHYPKDQKVFNPHQLPGNFPTWRAYRDFLLLTYSGEHLNKFAERFSKQDKNEFTFKQQVKQLLINDWEDNTRSERRFGNAKVLKDKWRSL